MATTKGIKTSGNTLRTNKTDAARLIAEIRTKLVFIESLASAARNLHAASADEKHDQATESIFEAISESATSVLNDSADCPVARLERMIEEVAA